VIVESAVWYCGPIQFKESICCVGGNTEQGEALYARAKFHANIANWSKAIVSAREELGIEGFCPLGGNTEQGKALYATAMSIYKWRYTD